MVAASPQYPVVFNFMVVPNQDGDTYATFGLHYSDEPRWSVELEASIHITKPYPGMRLSELCVMDHIMGDHPGQKCFTL